MSIASIICCARSLSVPNGLVPSFMKKSKARLIRSWSSDVRGTGLSGGSQGSFVPAKLKWSRSLMIASPSDRPSTAVRPPHRCSSSAVQISEFVCANGWPVL